MKKLAWVIFALLSVAIGLYPSAYFFFDRQFGLLSSKPDELLENLPWNIGFYTHIILGGISLLVGWAQFNSKWRTARPGIHRLIGKIYVGAVFLSALAGIYIGINATGGTVAKLGFIVLGIVWFFTTAIAFSAIKKGELLRHQKLMIYSYAACFAAVTLRLWLPLLMLLHHGAFEPAYRMVAWLCWVPNIAVAYWIVNRIEQKALLTS